MTGYFDGACTNNPGGTGVAGWVIVDQQGQVELVVETSRRVIGQGEHVTSNLAEYHGLLDLLTFIEATDYPVTEIYGDSKLVVNMVTGRWGKKKPHKKYPHLRKPLLKARALAKQLNIPIGWVPREENTLADSMTRLETN